MGKVWLWLVGLALIAAPARAADELPIFDAHLHYSAEAVAAFPLDQILAKLKRNGITGAAVSSRPNDGTRAIFEAEAPGLWVAPLARPYRTRADMATWFRDPEALAHVEAELARGVYRGVGEFHLHGEEAKGALVKAYVDLAVGRDIWLQAHSDEIAIEALFAHNPAAKAIWAHTGFGAAPETVERLIRKYPNLMCELSYRSGLVEGGKLTPTWRRLFETYPDRFLVGSDTWTNSRWDGYDEIIAGYRQWLAQLPRETAERIASGNAERIFGKR